MNKLPEKLYKYRSIILIPLFLILILLTIFWLYNLFWSNYITAKFSNSGPLHVGMPAYYKGYNIGEIKKVSISDDYKYTLVKIRLYPKELKLPENIVAKVKITT